MSNRLNILFEVLYRRNTSASIDELSGILGVSKRTVYNDIERLNTLLASSSASPIENRRGIFSRATTKGQDNFDSELSFSDLVNDSGLIYIDPAYRRCSLAETIICLPGPFSMDNLQQIIGVSRNTLTRDLREIRKLLSPFGVSIESRPFTGYWIDGEENAIRAALSSVLDDDLVYERVLVNEESSFITAVESFFTSVTNELGVDFSNASHRRIILSLFAAYKRIGNGHTLTQLFLQHQGSEITREFQVVNAHKSEIEMLYQKSNIPQGELEYVAAKLRESSVVKRNELISENWIQMSLLVQQFIQDVAKEFPMAHFEEDETLFQGILNHLRPAYWRAIADELIDNPMLSYIEEQCSDLHEEVSRSISIVENILHVSFPEEEVGYFTLFFAASLERTHKITIKKARAIVVCQEGLSTSQFLASRLETNFEINIVAVLSVREAQEWLFQNDIDLVVSTVSFTYKTYPVIEVSAWLTNDDKRRLANFLDPKHVEISPKKIIEIIRKFVPLNEGQANNIQLELAYQLGFSSREDIQKERYQPMLKEILSEELIECDYPAADRNQAVRKVGSLLVQKGLASEEYVDAMIENVEVNGTYIVIAPGIAMPHARPEKGAKSVGFSIVTLKEPVVFGHPSNDPVTIVIGLCAIDHQTHLKALSELADILSDPEKVIQLRQAATPQDVLSLIGEGK